MKPKLIVMVGLQASGKSTRANELAKSYNATVVSSDCIRSQNKELDNDKVFKYLYSQVNEYLSMGLNVIIDATNITIKARKQIFNNLNNLKFKMIFQFKNKNKLLKWDVLAVLKG